MMVPCIPMPKQERAKLVLSWWEERGCGVRITRNVWSMNFQATINLHRTHIRIEASGSGRLLDYLETDRETKFAQLFQTFISCPDGDSGIFYTDNRC